MSSIPFHRVIHIQSIWWMHRQFHRISIYRSTVCSPLKRMPRKIASNLLALWLNGSIRSEWMPMRSIDFRWCSKQQQVYLYDARNSINTCETMSLRRIRKADLASNTAQAMVVFVVAIIPFRPPFFWWLKASNVRLFVLIACLCLSSFRSIEQLPGIIFVEYESYKESFSHVLFVRFCWSGTLLDIHK